MRGSLNDKAKFLGWIPDDELPSYLNELKLLVLPSYTVGLPNVMLEAMACATRVLATSVGAIPDAIKNDETRFIMRDNSPECIARSVVKALNYPELDRLDSNGRAAMEKEYTYEVTVERYRNILTNLKEDVKLQIPYCHCPRVERSSYRGRCRTSGAFGLFTLVPF